MPQIRNSLAKSPRNVATIEDAKSTNEYVAYPPSKQCCGIGLDLLLA